jgi:hypothetical protein
VAHTSYLCTMGRSNYHQNQYWSYSFSTFIWPRSCYAYQIELTSLRLALQDEELNSTSIPQRINALLALEEQRSHALENLKRDNNLSKGILIRKPNQLLLGDEKVLLWDSSHANRGKHSKFQKLWLGPYKISSSLVIILIY